MNCQQDGRLRDLVDGLRDVETLLENVAEDRPEYVTSLEITDAGKAVEKTIAYLRDLRYSGDVFK